jgi:hypothetical protein
LKEVIPNLGISPSHSPAVADGGDHLALVGVNHPPQIEMNALERVPVAQLLLCDMEAVRSARDAHRDFGQVELTQ